MTTLQIVLIAAAVVFGLLYWMRRSANSKKRATR
jgi:hypothetical protein